jgi:hypothetical protein
VAALGSPCGASQPDAARTDNPNFDLTHFVFLMFVIMHTPL